jgi:hypothetical protein
MGRKERGECMKKQALDYKQTTINSKSCNALTLQLIKRHPNNKEMIQSAEGEKKRMVSKHGIIIHINQQ